MYEGNIIREYDLEDFLNSFLPKLFYEIESDEWGVTVRVPELVKDKVHLYLEGRLPVIFEIIVVGI